MLCFWGGSRAGASWRKNPVMLMRLLLQLETRRLLIIVFMPNLPDDNDNRKEKKKKKGKKEKSSGQAGRGDVCSIFN